MLDLDFCEGKVIINLPIIQRTIFPNRLCYSLKRFLEKVHDLWNGRHLGSPQHPVKQDILHTYLLNSYVGFIVARSCIASYPHGPFPDLVVGEGKGIFVHIVRIAPFEAESPSWSLDLYAPVLLSLSFTIFIDLQHVTRRHYSKKRVGRPGQSPSGNAYDDNLVSTRRLKAGGKCRHHAGEKESSRTVMNIESKVCI